MERKKEGEKEGQRKREEGRGVRACFGEAGARATIVAAALEATQGQMDGFFRQLPYKCHLQKVASVGD